MNLTKYPENRRLTKSRSRNRILLGLTALSLSIGTLSILNTQSSTQNISRNTTSNATMRTSLLKRENRGLIMTFEYEEVCALNGFYQVDDQFYSCDEPYLKEFNYGAEKDDNEDLKKRIEALEEDNKELKKRLSAVEGDVDTIKGQLSKLDNLEDIKKNSEETISLLKKTNKLIQDLVNALRNGRASEN